MMKYYIFDLLSNKPYVIVFYYLLFYVCIPSMRRVWLRQTSAAHNLGELLTEFSNTNSCISARCTQRKRRTRLSDEQKQDGRRVNRVRQRQSRLE